MKLVPENPGNKEVVVETPTTKKRYKANRGGIYEVENKNHAKQMLDNGFIMASLMGTKNNHLGFICKNCGFGSWFKTCSRCGTENEREKSG
jgi:hypothetical protein